MEFILKQLLANWIVSTVRKIHPLQTLLRLSGYAPETALISSYMEKSNTNLIVLSNHSHFWNNTQETAAISTPCWEGGGRCGGKWLLRSVGNKIFPLLVRLRDIKDNWLHAHEDMQLISRRAAGQLAMWVVKLGYPAAKLKTAEFVTGTECTGLHLWWQDWSVSLEAERDFGNEPATWIQTGFMAL